MERDGGRAFAPVHVRAVVLEIAHAFDAAGDDDVGRAAFHHHVRGQHGLQTTAAAVVQLHAGIDTSTGTDLRLPPNVPPAVRTGATIAARLLMEIWHGPRMGSIHPCAGQFGDSRPFGLFAD